MGRGWMIFGLIMLAYYTVACTEEDAEKEPVVTLPAQAQVLVEGVFSSAEGIAFNAEGRLFVVADKGVHEVFADGKTLELARLTDPVGMAPDGVGNLLVADWGDTFPMVGQNSEAKNDGRIVQVTPEGDTAEVATGIPDPNFLALWPDGSFLVSDDLDTYIYKVTQGESQATVWADSIVTPNGMAFSKDFKTLYVCQTFDAAGTMAMSNKVWSVPLDANGNPGVPEILAELESASAPDGIAIDSLGRVYVAANMRAKIWRIDPQSKETVLVAKDVPSVASLAFGRGGDFPTTSLYLTSLLTGNIYKLDLGVPGAPLP